MEVGLYRSVAKGRMTRRTFAAGTAGLIAALSFGSLTPAHAEDKIIAISFPNSPTIGAVITSLDQAKKRRE